MYDLIGDTHGHADALKTLLIKMDYNQVDGVWQHQNRKAIFIGDYIDRGPLIRETLHIVKDMVDANKAIALMGNHEYNALAYAYKLRDGGFLRSHNEKHNKQHRATLEQFEKHPNEWQDFIKWFYTLPLYLELPELRAIHACWDDDHINWLKKRESNTINEELLIEAHNRNSKAFTVIDDLLKGKEFLLPNGYIWKDKDQHDRAESRIKWWVDPDISTYSEFLFNYPDEIKDQKLGDGIKTLTYPKDAPPVFFGHYWLEDQFPIIQSSNVVCLDYSIASPNGGSLVAYRFNGEREVDNRQFVTVNYKDSPVEMV